MWNAAIIWLPVEYLWCLIELYNGWEIHLLACSNHLFLKKKSVIVCFITLCGCHNTALNNTFKFSCLKWKFTWSGDMIFDYISFKNIHGFHNQDISMAIFVHLSTLDLFTHWIINISIYPSFVLSINSSILHSVCFPLLVFLTIPLPHLFSSFHPCMHVIFINKKLLIAIILYWCTHQTPLGIFDQSLSVGSTSCFIWILLLNGT